MNLSLKNDTSYYSDDANLMNISDGNTHCLHLSVQKFFTHSVFALQICNVCKDHRVVYGMCFAHRHSISMSKTSWCGGLHEQFSGELPPSRTKHKLKGFCELLAKIYISQHPRLYLN